MLYTKPLANLIGELQKLPGIGPKSAQRLAFFLIRQPKSEIQSLADALLEAKERINACSHCCNLSAEDPCELCRHPGRQDDILCVVAEPKDLIALERTTEFKGRYHVLGGVISPLDGIGPEQLKVAELLKRLDNHAVQEVILALNPTIEGEATTLYILRLLKPLGLRITRLALGLPMGTELEYADELTLARALTGRREL
ncbi:MAG: recombination protein RecR [Cyanobacteria bacterium NC_groundwater_1444_Ag_S-0.65um_54_12]|nr:recombination protein RecR [Cyanobacteria bacterium NC_groundwater_1444_Ag_S-0.65um_54_12]